MSAVLIRQALEVALAAMTPSLATAWENVPFETVVGTPWQRVNMLPADARPLEMSGKWHEERGIFQISLFYPLNAGPAAAETRAELIRSTFKHGSEFSASGVTVRVDNVPSLTPLDDDAWFGLGIRIPFYAFIRRS